MLCMLAAGRAVFLQTHAIGIVTLVLITGVVPVAAISARPPETSIVNPALPCHVSAPFLGPQGAKTKRAGGLHLTRSAQAPIGASKLYHRAAGDVKTARRLQPASRTSTTSSRPISVPQPTAEVGWWYISESGGIGT